MTDDKDVYSFYKCADIHLPLRIRISSLVGKLSKHSRTELLEHPEYRFWGSQTTDYPDLYVRFRLYSDNKPLTPFYRTAYKQFHKGWNWNEWITFPWSLSELPLNAQISFTIYDTAGPNKSNVVGGTTFRLFGKRGTLRKAQHRLFVWKGQEGDGSAESSTPSKIGSVQDEMGRLEKLIKKHKRGDLPAVEWMDKLANRRAEQIYQADLEASPNIFLYIEMPQFELPLVFCEPDPKPITLPPLHTYATGTSAVATQARPSAVQGGAGARVGGSSAISGIDSSLFTIADAEIARESPIEAKHRRMARQHRSGPLDRELKPNASVRDQLNEILAYPPTRILAEDEMNLVWSFRFYLTRDPKGLTKFLKSVSWSDPAEAKQATDVLVPMWSEPAVDDALELLGPTFKDARVRAYAVSLLERADDSELILYLLQLVQAIKFDHLALMSASLREDRVPGVLQREQPREGDNAERPQRPPPSLRASSTASIFGEHRLADFLIRRGIRNAELGNNFYWYLLVECDDKVQGKLFSQVKSKFFDRLSDTPGGIARRESLERQTRMVTTLSRWAVELRFSKDARPRKIEKLRALISDPKSGLAEFQPPLTLPLDAKVSIARTVAEKSTVFKSSQLPLLLHFVPSGSEDNDDGESGVAASSNGTAYPVIFKNGDDLRQDQLVIQLFTLMDRLLRNENLDLRITPYKVLATAPEDGMVQFVQSQSIASIAAQYQGSVLNYLREHHPDPNSADTLGVKAEVLDTFVRSCAGYCVITYLLEVGDRHLDNLLVAPDGHFFHVDFGYILGRDPKPYPPPVKVCREMVECMGGANSPHYHRFKSLCFTAFTSLRKSANLILNLIALMVDANVRDIQREPDRAVQRVQEKFCLALNDGEAIKHLDRLLSESSYITTVMDKMHDWAQMLRA
ncbi:phosphatidylinositol 3-kinase [Tilletiaria anomala UBC 951]|uniref:Phosphatidylinositol 3-kinase VPS34 n=1 Tax=Tilletiaria anomala (strain ATCC 24038 / CBS 436.72 / UBC 951) TaxID=1037660 RepID=A0A066WNC1_TILAU|nr:phosphatidylinositol 3-kinase [Tilletiaria anomala UBC 951]KDN52489.1 phosphatidylinositol 3-kinase [Tilletiaria anomala UBC 951]